MNQNEIDYKLDAYARLTTDLTARLKILSTQIHHASGYKPVWDSEKQAYRFISRLKGRVPKKFKLFGWFGNSNNKGRKWTPERHEMANRNRQLRARQGKRSNLRRTRSQKD